MRTFFFGIFLFLLVPTAYADGIEFSDGWARESIPGSENGAAYGTFINTSDQAVVIKNVNSKVAQLVEVHTHVMDEGVMSMQQVEALKIPANDQLSFKPGSYHFMLFGLTSALKSGQSFELQLHLTNGETQDITIRIK